VLGLIKKDMSNPEDLSILIHSMGELSYTPCDLLDEITSNFKHF